MKTANKTILIYASAFLSSAFTFNTFAANLVNNSTQTKQVLSILFKSSQKTIPKQSSCNGDYGQKGPALIGDLLAMQLAYMQKGTNAIAGQCDVNNLCKLNINHSAGEDVYSAEISFNMSKNKLMVDTLSCIITP